MTQATPKSGWRSRIVGHGVESPDQLTCSGTTLIAAERQGRRCYAVEIEPKYVQIAIERWQNYTGGTAELVA